MHLINLSVGHLDIQPMTLVLCAPCSTSRTAGTQGRSQRTACLWTQENIGCGPYLLVVGEGLHAFQEKMRDSAKQTDRHAQSQVLLGQVKHTGTGCQLHVQGGGVVLHPQCYQLGQGREIGRGQKEIEYMYVVMCFHTYMHISFVCVLWQELLTV